MYFTLITVLFSKFYPNYFNIMTEFLWNNIFRLLTMLLVLVGEESLADTPYCTAFTGTPSPGDPSLPDLPDQFQTIIDVNIVDKSYSITAYEYFDNPGNRAAVWATKNNTINISLFDYTSDQVIYIIGKTCTVRDLAKDANDVLFSNITKGGIPHILNTAGALHFAKGAGQMYIGKAVVRGIQVDHWRSCLFWPQLRANFTLDYYFSAENWQDAIAYPRIPVRAYVKGVQFDFNNAMHTVEHYYDYIDFRTEITDETVFEIPVGVVCPTLTTKPFPTLPNYFHAKIETFKSDETKVAETDIWYDSTTKLVRYDLQLQSPAQGFQTGALVTIVNDYNTGIKYLKDKISGGCKTMPISDKEVSSSINDTAREADSLFYAVSMKDPAHVLGVDENFTYSGKRTVRGLPCNVYSGLRPVELNIWATFEYYVLADGYSYLPDDDPSTSRGIPVQLTITNDTLGLSEIQTFTTFSTVRPEASTFDISACYPENSTIQLNVRFQGDFQTGLRGQIIREAQAKLSAVMQVSPIRVQNVRLDYDNSFVYVSAKLLDTPHALDQFTVVGNFTSYSLNDLSYPSATVTSPAQCSMLCLDLADFTCNSFDFCPGDSNHICRLSRTHSAGLKTEKTGSSCVHYSRTVDGVTKPGLSSQEAYKNLWNTVYNGQLQLQTFLPSSPNPIMFTAVDLSVSYGQVYNQRVPLFAGQFSYHLEATLPKVQQVFNSHIWYDYEYKLVRYDVLSGNQPMSNIHDYNSGLAYVINRNTLQCQVSRITNSSFDVIATPETGSGYVLQLKNPLQLFYLTQNFLYVGQKTRRGILCDAYENVGNFNFGSGMQQSIFQFYFMTQEWQEVSENSGEAVPYQPISLVVTAANSTATTVYEFSDFNEQHPDLDNFNIQTCFPADQQRHVIVQFNQTYHPTLDKYLSIFIKNVQIQMSSLTGISPLRFQNPQVTYDGPNTFYIATMVEQSPSILDFTKTSNKAGIYTMDATYVDIASAIQCADVCRNMTGFTCLSFDYCPSSRTCQLSKRHGVDGNLLNTSVNCDHYSQTVDSVLNLEPTTDQAITMLQDRIAQGDLVITVTKDDNTTITYPGVFFSRNVFRYDYGKESSTTLAHFSRTKFHALHVRNDPAARWIRYMPVSVDECADKCLNHGSFECQSYSYCPDMGLCLLSDLHPDENATTFEVSESCDLYSRKYTDMYQVYTGTYINDGNAPSTTNVASPEICAKQCARNTNPVCKSFDFCLVSKTCYFSPKHTLDFAKKTSSAQEFCVHYTKKYLFDFSMTPDKHLSVGPSMVISNSTVETCAEICVEMVSFTCQSFMFCGHSTCNLFSVHPRAVQPAISANAVCDLFTRNVPVQSASRNTNNTPLTGVRYSSGSMAAVAFGTLIPGMVIGAAILYFSKTKRLVKRQQEHEMNILYSEDGS